ncbi:AraC family transcriptional regulator [Pseudomonas sp. M47T1]|uniref:helix-turn-helix domain-containing protein n=1 Tax=unclassified Pseudomonas TaxID=196821 RepID=UPI0002606F5D|nr:AraC family transcriptional regulator [Pseudomonas sp. M47T1]EIK95726.1 AraC family transcriptional regulator [Pseudomonas sp. M47T1]
MNATPHAAAKPLDPTTLDLLLALAATLADNGPAAPQALYQHSSALCTHLLVQYGDRPAPAPERVALSPWQARRAKQLMLEQMSTSPSIADIAKACSLSRSHFSRAFKRTTGQSPRDWLLSARLSRAKELLADGNVPIAQVGLDCGFADQSHFTRVFTRCLGTTPFAWRRALPRGIDHVVNTPTLTN